MDIKPKAIDDKRAHTIKGKLSTRLQLNLNLEERFSQYFFSVTFQIFKLFFS